MEEKTSEIQKKLNLDSEQGEIAIRYGTSYGGLAPTFTVAVRNLMLDHRMGRDNLSEQSEFSVNRLLRAPTVMSAVYFAANSIYPQNFKGKEKFSRFEIARMFDPLSLAYILAALFLYRRARRICIPEEWRFLSENIQRNFEIAKIINKHRHDLELNKCMIASTMHQFAFSLFLAHDKKAFTEYRKLIKKNGLIFDSNLEAKHFGCTSVQVATNLLVAFGFGVDQAHDYSRGLSADIVKISNEKEGWHQMHHVKLFLGSAYQKKTSESNKYDHLISQDLVAFNKEISEVSQTIVADHWLESSKVAIAEGKTPYLDNNFEEQRDLAEEVSDIKEKYESLPDHIKEVLEFDEFVGIAHMSIEEIVAILEGS